MINETEHNMEQTKQQLLNHLVECICNLCPMDKLYVSKKRAMELEDMATMRNKCPVSLSLEEGEKQFNMKELCDKLTQEEEERKC